MTRARVSTLRPRETPARAGAGGQDPSKLLTPKEQACLRLVAQHLSSKEIALSLGIAKTSVDTYCDRARGKLGVADRYEAARRLMAHLGTAAPLPTVEALSAPPQPAPVLTPTSGFLADPQPKSPGPWAIAALALAAVLALATLLSGLRAIGEATTPPKTLHAAR